MEIELNVLVTFSNWKMAFFHYRCGENITLLHENCTAVRNDNNFEHGLVLSAEPLVNDILFEIKIDRKVNSWTGSLAIGVIDKDPLRFEFQSCASKIQSGSWILSSSTLYRNGECVLEQYTSFNLERLSPDDRVGVMRTSDGNLVFVINGESQGVAAENLPNLLYAIIDLYGKFVQVTITNPTRALEYINDDCCSGSSVLAIENDTLNVTLGGDLSELSMSSNSNSFDIRMDLNNSICMAEELNNGNNCRSINLLRFHERCGTLVKLSNCNRSAERLSPLDEFNNGIVMTHRPLNDEELFEIRIDRLVEKWSGSIEMGITTHNPNTLKFPATMTNMRSGTIMMSGCGILTNGRGTRREYGDFNLDELSESDRVGLMRASNGDLHYYINGLDQGGAAQKVPKPVWGVIDLYGMTTKVSIVERDQREEQNLVTRRHARVQQRITGTSNDDDVAVTSTSSPVVAGYVAIVDDDCFDRLTFHPNCGAHAQVKNAGRTAHRPNASDDFNNGAVLTARPLKPGEVFQIRLDRIVTRWSGSIEIGVTTHSPLDLDFPFTMMNVRSGTWMMTGTGVMHNGSIILEDYGTNLDRLQVGDRVGVVRKENGTLHFLVNSVDQGVAATNVPPNVYGVIDLYGQAVETSIVDLYDCDTPDSNPSSVSSSTIYSDMRFHHIHGNKVRIINNGVTAIRPRPLSEFNDAIVFSSRPLRDSEMFEVCLDNLVDRWSGSIELGVTAIRPDDIELPTTATDLRQDTWMLSGSSVMANGKTIRCNYSCDLDTLSVGIRLGVIVHPVSGVLEFYCNGVPQGIACTIPQCHLVGPLYAVIDLYGQCAQVSIPSMTPLVVPPTIHQPPLALLMTPPVAPTMLENNPVAVDNNASIGMEVPPIPSTMKAGGGTVQPQLTTMAHKLIGANCRHHREDSAPNNNNSLLFSESCLVVDELFEVGVAWMHRYFAGSLLVGVSSVLPSTIAETYRDSEKCWYLTGNTLRQNRRVIRLFTPNLNWLTVGDRIGLLRTKDGTLNMYINKEKITVNFPPLPDKLYPMFAVDGACVSLVVHSYCQNSQSKALPTSSGCQQEKYIEEFIGSTMPKFHRIPPVIVQKNYEFHENHGRNIELIGARRGARRVASYNQGVVVVQPAIPKNIVIQIQIEQLDVRWKTSILIGAIQVTHPDRLNLPISALALKSPCCIVSNDWISINGVKTLSNCGQFLANLEIGDRIGVCHTDTGYLQLLLNGNIIEIIPTLFAGHTATDNIHAVFDLYGRCVQIRLVDLLNTSLRKNSQAATGTNMSEQNVTCTTGTPDSTSNTNNIACNNRQLVVHQEKADLENGEKNNSVNADSNRFLLMLPTCNESLNSRCVVRSLLSSPKRPPHCEYRQECDTFRRSLLLPEVYFALDSGIVCYCTTCSRIRCQTVAANDNNDLEKSENFTNCGITNWVRFPLRHNCDGNCLDSGVRQDLKWHTAFWPTQVRDIRTVLDRAQPLTKGQSEWSTIVYRREDEQLQMVFYPNLQQCHPTAPAVQLIADSCTQNRQVRVAFQLLVKPNAYSIVKREPNSSVIEWTTKESGAILLHSLLIHISDDNPVNM